MALSTAVPDGAASLHVCIPYNSSALNNRRRLLLVSNNTADGAPAAASCLCCLRCCCCCCCFTAVVCVSVSLFSLVVASTPVAGDGSSAGGKEAQTHTDDLFCVGKTTRPNSAFTSPSKPTTQLMRACEPCCCWFANTAAAGAKAKPMLLFSVHHRILLLEDEKSPTLLMPKRLRAD